MNEVSTMNTMIVVPVQLRAYPVAYLPVSFRLAGALERLQAKRLGDLHGLALSQFSKMHNVGLGTVTELLALLDEAREGAALQTSRRAPVSLHALIQVVDESLRQLDDRLRDILLRRCGAAGNEAQTLEQIGKADGFTRENVRRLEQQAVTTLRKLMGPRAGEFLTRMAEKFEREMRPVDCQELRRLVGDATLTHGAGFYLRVFRRLSPRFPAWPKGHEPAPNAVNSQERLIIDQLLSVLELGRPPIPLKEAYQATLKSGSDRIAPHDFLEAIRRSKRLTVEMTAAGACLRAALTVKQNHFRSTEAHLREVLTRSAKPLTVEEIVARSERLTGTPITLEAHSLHYYLVRGADFYLLGPKRYGTARHFMIPEKEKARFTARALKLLVQEGRPLSVVEMLKLTGAEWGREAKYELAAYLRTDQRFTSLGRLMFSHQGSGLTHRPVMADEALKVLRRTGHPMLAAALITEIRKTRSVSAGSVATKLAQSGNGIINLGFGYYALAEWGDKRIKEFWLTHPPIIKRLLRASVNRRITFAELCERYEVTVESQEAALLWQALKRMGFRLGAPGQRTKLEVMLPAGKNLWKHLRQLGSKSLS